MVFEVVNGRRVKFWRDSWCRDEPLRVAFPIVFAITASKGAWVEEVWDGSMEENCWTLRIIRALDDWELEEAERLLLELQGRRIDNTEDRMVWVRAKDGRFVVKRLYGDLELGGRWISLLR